MLKEIAIAPLLLSSLALAWDKPYVGDTSGCGKPQLLKVLDRTRNVKSAGLERSYVAHLPATYDPKKQYPVLVGYHGSQSIPLFLEVDSKLDEARFTGDKIVIYPAGIGGAWAGPSYAKTTVAQDLQFTYDLLADARKEFCIDSSRIYATGLSNGGGFVGSLACNDTVGGEFAAFAPVAGSFYTDLGLQNQSCKPVREVTPILEFHGGADADVFYNGGKGEGGQLPTITDWLNRWVTRNGCKTPPSVNNTFNNDVHHYTWTCHGVDGALQHYKVDDMKHVWPSTEPNFSQAAAKDKPTHIQASALMQTFFAKFIRPAVAAC